MTIDPSHVTFYPQGSELTCRNCRACKCHKSEILEAPCAEADVPLFEGELPVFYEYGETVLGRVSGIRKPNGTVVLTITMREEAGLKIIDMLIGKVPLALSWALRLLWVKKA